MIDRFFVKHDKFLIIDVMGLSYHISISHNLYEIDQVDVNRAWHIRTEQIVKSIIDYIKTQDFEKIVLDGRGNARYSAKLCRYIAKNITFDSVILSSVPPELELPDQVEKFDTIVDYAGTVDWQNYYTELAEKNIDWESIKLDSILLILANRPSLQRAEYIKEVTSLLGDRCRASFGSRELPTATQVSTYTKMIHPLP